MRWRSVLLTASSALALASCGGEEQQVERRTETVPTIERAVAKRLAARSDSIAATLEAGDPCGAARAAAELREDAIATINRGGLPELYLEEFLGAVHELEATIPACEELEDEPDGEKAKGKKKGKKKGKGRGNEGDG